MSILTTDLILRRAALFKCVTVNHWSFLFFLRREVQICCTGEMERAIKILREINTLIICFYFLHMYRYKIPCVKFLKHFYYYCSLIS